MHRSRSKGPASRSEPAATPHEAIPVEATPFTATPAYKAKKYKAKTFTAVPRRFRTREVLEGRSAADDTVPRGSESVHGSETVPAREEATIAGPAGSALLSPERIPPESRSIRGLTIPAGADSTRIMVSMDLNRGKDFGKIGSVYFPDGSRIRTTHEDGPGSSQRESLRQLNVDTDAVPETLKKGDRGHRKRDYSKVDPKLTDDSRTPSWARRVKYTGTGASQRLEAPEIAKAKPSQDLRETFTRGGQAKAHISRGTAVGMELSYEALQALDQVVSDLDTDDSLMVNEALRRSNPGEAARRIMEKNKRFYEGLQAPLPGGADNPLMGRIRRMHPEDDGPTATGAGAGPGS